jgi:hypothetical protein
MSLTGDPLTDRAVGPAAQLVKAVRKQDPAAVDEILADAHQSGPDAVNALLVVLAAMVPDDVTPPALLAWLADPAEYRRLRACGVSGITAGARVRMGLGRRREIA